MTIIGLVGVIGIVVVAIVAIVYSKRLRSSISLDRMEVEIGDPTDESR